MSKIKKEPQHNYWLYENKKIRETERKKEESNQGKTWKKVWNIKTDYTNWSLL